MAIGYRLTTTRYVKPGVYIGQIYIPRPVANLDIPRIPCFIGRGSESKVLRDFAMTRGQVKGELLGFVTSQAPYRALLDYISDGNKQNTTVYNHEGEEISKKLWEFKEDISGDPRIIQMSSIAFDPTANYYVDYQSTSVDTPDKYGEIAGITGTEKIIRVGRNPAVSHFDENTDFEVITELLNPTQLLGAGTGDISCHINARYEGPTRQYTLIVETEATVDTPVYTGPTQVGGTGTGTISLGSSNDYLGVNSALYTFEITNKSGSTFDVIWDSGGAGGSGTLVGISTTNKTNVHVELGIYLDFDGLADFDNGDTFTLNIVMTPKSALNITWFSDDPKGASGNFDITYYGAVINGEFHPRTRIPLENGIYLTFGDLENFEANDEWQIDAINTDSLNWDMEREAEEVISSSDIFYDHAGTVVGTRRTFYAFLSEAQTTEVLSVTNNTTGSPIPYVWVQNTAYITFTADPGVDLKVRYKYRNAPEPGQGYYITVQYTRPEDEYDVVKYVTRNSFRDEVGYASPTNHIAIMLDHVYESFGQLGTCAFIQCRDLDRDGMYNTVDYRRAVYAARYSKEITDLVILGHVASLDAMYQVIQERNDPFEGKESIAWIGWPDGTEIGFSDEEEGTLASWAKSLQVYGDNPARGCFLGVANTWAKRYIVQEDNTYKLLTLDGSFISGALAAMQAAFDVPYESELRKAIPGYEEIHEYGDFDQRRVGRLQYTFLTRRDVITRVEDIVTFDTSAPDYHEVNAMRQKQFVTKFIRRELDKLVIGIVPLSVAQGVSLIRTAMAGLLRTLVSRQLIAPYMSDEQFGGGGENVPADRDLDPNSDIEIFRDETDPTLYHMRYWFVLRYVLKRIFGVYSVDVKAF